MKNYFGFNLTGKKLLPIWLLFMVFFMIPYAAVQVKLQSFQPNASGDLQDSIRTLTSVLQLNFVMLLLIVVEFIFLYYLIKITLENLEFKEKTFEFTSKFGEFIGEFLIGFVLTIITLGIYSPWFITRIYKLIAKKTIYNSANFEFRGKGSDLFLIILFAIVLPMILIMALVIGFTFANKLQGNTSPLDAVMSILMVIAIIIIMIPYMYLVYKWMVDYKYKNYEIRWESNFWKATGAIATQILLSIVTLGIYSPLASLRLYKYFAEITFARSEEGTKRFGYDIEPGSDFLFLWGQILLTSITLGIYFPWAYCKISKKVLQKTYVEDVVA
jgi:uncharacterized membrane protein YjgN (DUF898 family)